MMSLAQDAAVHGAKPVTLQPGPGLRDVSELPMAHERPDGLNDLEFLYQLRELGPLVRDKHGIVIAFTHEALMAVYGPGFRQNELDTYQLQQLTLEPLRQMFSSSLLFSNGETHKRRRTPLAKAFAHPLMNRMRPEIRRLAREMIEPLVGAGEQDFLGHVASAMPARIIANILGLPKEDEPRFTQLVYSAIRGISIRSPEIMAQASADTAELNAYVDGLIKDRRKSPREDFLTEYLRRTEGGDLDELEIRTQVSTLIAAGADTTRLSLAMTAARLAQHPEQYALLRRDPDGVKKAVAAEGLRFDPVVASRNRIVAEELGFFGVRFQEGAIVSPSMIAALRDPAVYAEPDRFNIERQDHVPLHPIFGGGPHRCLGEALAWAELEETLAALAELSESPKILGEPPEMRGLGAVREITPMMIKL